MICMNPMSFLEHVTITILPDRWESTLAFYRSILGLDVALSAGDGKQVLLDGGKGAVLGFNRQDEPAEGFENHLGFYVDSEDWDRVLGELKQAGLLEENSEQAWTGSTYTYCRDPAGTRIQLLRRPKPMLDRFK
jgi:catechol 2,3-dioxygenase-like lactoylglutathione lyase family enzyme